MAHHVYTTPGFIIDSRPHREAGKLLYIFTRELGLVLATAQGVRLSVSKLRYHTQDFAYGVFSLVRGKEMWRLIGAGNIDGAELAKDGVSEHNIDDEISSSANVVLRARVFALLRRLLHGEEANPELFEIVVAFENCILNENIGASSELIECLIVLRILYALGYVNAGEITGSGASESAHNSQLADFIQNPLEWNTDLIEKVNASRSTIITAINKGIQASQL